MKAAPELLTDVGITAPPVLGEEQVLTSEALSFLAGLHRRFGQPIADLLRARAERQQRFDEGEKPDFLRETREIRSEVWSIAPVPANLVDRRVEITGPVDRKMVINALNSGAEVFMADFEDATTPSWSNLILGQRNLMEAVRRTLRFEAPDTGRTYELGANPATLFVRPRGLHLEERHVRVDKLPVAAALFDFGLYFFHNARALRALRTGCYFYLPKLESHIEARLWNDVFVYAERALDLPLGTIKATVLIETLPAAFEMDEILYELQDHSAGLNCGRWDYIFSFIKKLRSDATRVLPDRADVTMDRAFLRAYSELLVETCHRRGAHAMGGMAAQIPIRGDVAANAKALDRVWADKVREVKNGHDGTWVAHPGLVELARSVFEQHMAGPNQLEKRRDCRTIGQRELLEVPEGRRTEAGLRHNVRVGLLYLEAWLRGSGCVPLFNLMEDAATAEICRAQIWQWIRHSAVLDGSQLVTRNLVSSVIGEETAAMTQAAVDRGAREDCMRDASELFTELVLSEDFVDFLTLPAYERLLAQGE